MHENTKIIFLLLLGLLICNTSANANDSDYLSSKEILISGSPVSGQINNATSINEFGNHVKINDLSLSIPLFSKSDYNPMINGAYGSMWYNGTGDYHAYYSYRANIYHATSSDGENWTVDTVHNPVLAGTPGSWDASAVEVPVVWKENKTWYMLYRGYNESVNYERYIGLATSSDGINWIKNSNRPVLNVTLGTWEVSDNLGLDPWGLIKVGYTYYLWFNTINDYSSYTRATGLATSNDLIHWTRDPNNPIFTNGRYCTQPFKYGNYYYMIVPYYRGKFELYRDLCPTFYRSEREYLGIILKSERGTWDQNYLDTPSVLTKDIYKNTFPDPSMLWIYYTGTNFGTLEREGLATSPLMNFLGAQTFSSSQDVSISVALEKWLKIGSALQSYSLVSDKK